uniref:Uncharacterized protein n=1 Tax=Cacopsylla melanoneura TaxID=428564 RepID=A0A8D8ZQ45_9HEMI
MRFYGNITQTLRCVNMATGTQTVLYVNDRRVPMATGTETVLYVNKPLVTMVTITRTLLYVHKFRVTMETGTETFLYVNEQSVTVANCNAGSTPGERSTIAHDHSHASSERCVSECS